MRNNSAGARGCTPGALASARTGDGLIGPAVLADQRHESHGAEILLMERVLAIAHDLDQPLLVGEHADGHDQASADLELIAQGLRDFRSARGHDDGVERCGLGPSQGAVAMAHLDVAIAEPREPLLGRVRQRAVTLDRVDLAGDPAQHGGGVAGAGPDLQHPVAGLHRGGFDHECDDEGWEIVCPCAIGSGLSS